MATEVLRPQNIFLPQKIRTHRKPPHRPTTPKASSKPIRQPSLARPFAANKSPAERKTREMYAGPAFSVSPEPSSLPLPQFPVRKAVAAVAVDAAATRSLRRMLGLE